MKDNKKTGESFEKYDVNEALFFQYMRWLWIRSVMEKREYFPAFKELKHWIGKE